MKPWRRRLLLLAVGTAVAVAAAEGVLRWWLPRELFVAGRDTEGWTENTPTFDSLMNVDARVGFLPKRGTWLFDERGLNRDHALDLELPQGPTRVLWIGDSVTARRFIERACRRLSPVPFTSLNGGVEGYNAAQTADYFERVTSAVSPDAVVFTLHHNDWMNTPVVFHDDDGRVHCRTTDSDVAGFSPWLFRHSYLYRFGFQFWLGFAGVYDAKAADAQVAEALRALRDRCAAMNVPFAVLVLPPLRAEAEWNDGERARHAHAVSLLGELGIRHVDLLPGLRRGLAASVDPQQAPGDWMHPSEAIAPFFAEEVVRAGVLPTR